MTVEALRGAVVGPWFIGKRRGATTVRLPRKAVLSTVERAVAAYLRGENIPLEIRSWLEAVGGDGVEVLR